MRVALNLATKPFRQDRAMLVGSSVVAAGLAVLLLILISISISDRGSMAESRRSIARIERSRLKVSAEQRKLDGELRKSGNADVFERSQFINLLLYRKGVSWTKLFDDLEHTVPSNVLLVSVRPQIDAKDHIYLDMVVGADTQKPVIDLLTKFEASPVFGSTAVYGIVPPSQTDKLYRYRLSVNYAQKL